MKLVASLRGICKFTCRNSRFSIFFFIKYKTLATSRFSMSGKKNWRMKFENLKFEKKNLKEKIGFVEHWIEILSLIVPYWLRFSQKREMRWSRSKDPTKCWLWCSTSLYSIFLLCRSYKDLLEYYKTCVSQSSQKWSLLSLEIFEIFFEILNLPDGQTDVKTPCVEIVITTGRDCGAGLVDQ